MPLQNDSGFRLQAKLAGKLNIQDGSLEACHALSLLTERCKSWWTHNDDVHLCIFKAAAVSLYNIDITPRYL